MLVKPSGIGLVDITRNIFPNVFQITTPDTLIIWEVNADREHYTLINYYNNFRSIRQYVHTGFRMPSELYKHDSFDYIMACPNNYFVYGKDKNYASRVYRLYSMLDCQHI